MLKSSTKFPLKVKRVYDSISDQDGTRLLVDRLWPRGIKKTELKLDGWFKEVAPSALLRKWYAHNPAKWMEFQKKYVDELAENPEAWKPIMALLAQGPVTLLYSARDQEHNHAICLRNFLISNIA